MTSKWIVIISLLVILVSAPPLTAEEGDPYDKWEFDAENLPVGRLDRR